MRDNEQYWVIRHQQLEGSLASIGKIGTPEGENRQRYARKKRRLIKLLRSLDLLDLSGKSVLDAGCGTGVMSELLYALGAEVSGIDASHIAITEAAHRANPNAKDSGRFLVGSLVEFEFDCAFDLTFCLDVLYHIVADANWETTLRTLLRHTKDGGFLVILEQLSEVANTTAPHVRFRTKAMYDAVLRDLPAVDCSLDEHPGFLVYRHTPNGGRAT